MHEIYHYIYCNGILGVKTNVRNFKWVYGSVAPLSDINQFQNCNIKFEVYVEPEKELSYPGKIVRRFQAYTWDDETNILHYRRVVFGKLTLGYNIQINGNTVIAHIGKRYWTLIKNRTMNLHSAYYLLSDLASMMLLHNEFLTLYASAVYFPSTQRSAVCWAPPNTGKTLTATKLCESSEYSLVGEDIVITDGKCLFACPWTSSYRKKSSIDSAGLFGRVKKIYNRKTCPICELTDLFVLSLGIAPKIKSREETVRKITMLNGYLFNYHMSPIIKILGFFDERYCRSWNDYADFLLLKMISDKPCQEIYCEKPMDFYPLLNQIISGEKK